MDQYIDIKVRVWRQAGPKAQGHFETYDLKHVFQGASFLEMIDILNAYIHISLSASLRKEQSE